jgi:ribulose-phosphate 3-epimerase
MRLKIAPSILSAHFERLGDDVRAVEEAGADQIHVDVMDGHFVPNLSMGPVVVEALRRVTRLPLDVHLMITDPEKYLESFAKAGAHHVTFHVEVAKDPIRLASWLHERGIGAGLALNPETPVDRVLPLASHFDMILVMTVHPGFGGQSFLEENLEKVKAVRALRPIAARPLDVEVDGGIDASTALLARDAGANVFVAGNAIFGSHDPRGALGELRARLGPRAAERTATSGTGRAS